MTVALVLATATVRDRAARAAGSAAGEPSPAGSAAIAGSGSAGDALVLGDSSTGGDTFAAGGTLSPATAAARATAPAETSAGVAGAASPGAASPGAASPGAGAGGSAAAGTGAGAAPAAGAAGMQAPGPGTAAERWAAALPLPGLSGGEVDAQPLLGRLSGQLAVLGSTEITVIAPAGQGAVMAAMAWEGLSKAGAWLGAAGNIEVTECASVGAELRAVAAAANRAGDRGEALLICAGDVVAHTEALARLTRGQVTTALTAALTDTRGGPHLALGPDVRPALRLDGAGRPGSPRLGAALGDAGLAAAGGLNGDGDGLPPSRAVVAAGSAFHRVHAPNAVGCGVFLVAPADAADLATAAGELASLADAGTAGPAGRAGQAVAAPAAGRSRLAAEAGGADPASSAGPGDSTGPGSTGQGAGAPGDAGAWGAAGPGGPDGDGSTGHGGGAEAAGRPPRPSSRGGSGFSDSVALLLVGLVRGGVPVAALDAAPLLCMRVQTMQQARSAAAQLHAVREDRVRLDSAVEAGDGLFATCFVNPYSRYLARWAARRRQSPGAVACMSAGLGLLAATWFSAGSRAGLITGTALLFAALVFDRAGGQLARYARVQTPLGSWLAGVGGRVTEFAVYAGLAAGAARTAAQPRAVWELAVAAMIVQSVRDMISFSPWPPRPRPAGAAAGQPGPGGPADAGLSLAAAPAGGTPAAAHHGPGVAGVAGVAGVPAPGAAALRAGRPASEHRAVLPRLPLDEPADYAIAPAGAGQNPGGAGRPGRIRARARLLRRLRRAGARWLVKLLEFQPGDRLAVIGVTALVAGTAVTFVVLLAWGVLATCVVVGGRIVRSYA